MSQPNIWDGITPVAVGGTGAFFPTYNPTRRERFALEALRAIGANGFTGTTGELAEEAVRLADKLLAKLDKPRG